jgi:transketolase
MAEYKDLTAKVIKLGKMTCRMCTEAGSGHPSSGLSLAHLTVALMYRIMRYDPKNPWHSGADRLVLSEGHAVPIIYAAYCELEGVAGTQRSPRTLKFDDALTLRATDSLLDGHPNPAIGFPFFDSATGSLGQGISAAAGLAAADKVDGGQRNIFCICGDGESREGQIWEALDFIVDHKLHKVRVIFNCNGQGQSDHVSEQQSADQLKAKLEAFNFEVKVIDGHDFDQITDALTAEATDKPIAVVARTIKGWGVPALQDQGHHGKPLKEDEVPAALEALEAKAQELGVSEADEASALQLTDPEPVNRSQPGTISAGGVMDGLKAAGFESAIEKGKLATRRAYGAALKALGADDSIVALDGDVQGSTFANAFAETYPDRYFEAKIAEQNMVTTAVGLAATGKVPFVSSFAKFIVRAYDQVEMAAVTNANIKMCGSHSGVSLAADGPSQMGLPDVAFFRSFANSFRVDGKVACRVFQPSDAVMAYKLTEMMANSEGMCYMRTHRPDVAFIYDENETFDESGFKHLRDGEDLCIVASGYMTHVATKAVEMLEEKAGLNASLIDAYLLPLDTQEILQIGDDCRGQILVVEDNYVGGFADEIAAAAAKSDLGVAVETMHVRSIPKSSKTPEETLKAVGLTAEDIVKTAQELFDSSEA